MAKGRIKSIDRAAALAVPGVIEVFAHDNRPSVASSHKKYTDEAASPGSPFRPLYDETILFAGQPLALVVAEEPEIARFAAELVSLECEKLKRRSPISTRKSTRPIHRRKSGLRAGSRMIAGLSTNHSSARRCKSSGSIALLSSITIPWSALARLRCGKATEGLLSTTRRKAHRTATTMFATCSASPRTRFASYRLMSEAPLAWACGRIISCFWQCWRQ